MIVLYLNVLLNTFLLIKSLNFFIRRSGSDLILRLEIELVEALCGFQKIIKTLDDRSLVISAIPGNFLKFLFISTLIFEVLLLIHTTFILGEVLKHGDVKCVLNEGMPQYKNPFEKGRMIIQFLVNFPDKLPAQKVSLLESCLPAR